MAYWVDDGIDTWPESIRAGRAAMGLYLLCGAWISRGIGGGTITDAIVPVEVATMYGTREWITKLVAVGLWEHVEDGYRDTRYHQMGNPTADKVAADKAAKKARQQRWLAKRKAEQTETRRRRSRDASHDPSRDASRDIAPSHPPIPSGWDGRARPREARGAGGAPPPPPPPPPEPAPIPDDARRAQLAAAAKAAIRRPPKETTR